MYQKTLGEKIIDTLNSLKFWVATLGAALFLLELKVAGTLTWATALPVLEGWAGAIFASRVIDNLNPKKDA